MKVKTKVKVTYNMRLLRMEIKWPRSVRVDCDFVKIALCVHSVTLLTSTLCNPLSDLRDASLHYSIVFTANKH